MSETAKGLPGRVTIVDVAAHAGVSVASVSNVLRNAYGTSAAMHEKVQASMGALGYRAHRPARGMRGRTYTIGMVVPDIENPFFDLLSSGLDQVLESGNYELLIAAGGASSQSQLAMIDALIDHRMDGIALVAPLASDEELDRIASSIPLVLVGRHSKSEVLDSVAGDDALGADLVVDHLVKLGHERIGFVRHSTEAQNPLLPQEMRLKGFLQAVEAHDVEGLLIPGRWTLEGGRDAARNFLDLSHRPTAVHGGADITAIGMLDVLWRAGLRAPHDLSLAGYDNSTTSALSFVELTTVDQDGRAMGKRAGELLLQRIGGRSETRHEKLTPCLVARSSTAAPSN